MIQVRYLLVACVAASLAACGSNSTTAQPNEEAVVADVTELAVPGDAAVDVAADAPVDRDLEGAVDLPAADVAEAAEAAPEGVMPVEVLEDDARLEASDEVVAGCGTGPACGADQQCCNGLMGANCIALTDTCQGGGFGCTGDGDCQSGSICCDFYGQMKMCMPDTMCPGAPGGCTLDTDCKAGQVCCKFGSMATQPTCMADGMCPKNCTLDSDCPSTQECCDLKDNVLCLDKGQCPQRCHHSTAECPLGQECCDAGGDLLVCQPDANCPGSVSCAGPTDVCKTQDGQVKDGFTCCDVPEVGYKCVGSGGGCGNWQTCATSADCPDGRECCPLKAGLTCVPTGACATPSVTYVKCQVHADCSSHNGQICCIVPGQGPVCADAAQCPSQCLTDSECGTGYKCCVQGSNAAACMTESDCSLMQPCDADGKCATGQECCTVQGSKLCMPQGQCIGGACTTDTDCAGQKCCSVQGAKMCMPQCF